MVDRLCAADPVLGDDRARRCGAGDGGADGWRRPGAALLRAFACALLLAALADPSFVQEDRRPLKDVVAVVVDQSESNQIDERPKQTAAARAELEKRLAALDNVEVREVETPRSDLDNRGTQLFAALRSALADTPPERVGGAVLLTDGNANDIPASPGALGFDAPVHVLITGHEGERNRRIELIEAPRSASSARTRRSSRGSSIPTTRASRRQ